MESIISVIICTLNRADTLKSTIQALLTQTLSNNKYEIIIVDNGSTDHTRSVVEGLQQNSVAHLLYVSEAKQGLSIARNKGILLSKGEVIAFLDDDAIAHKEWLANITETFSATKRVDAMGGPIEPYGPLRLPSWFPGRLASHLSIVDYGKEPIFLKYPHYPFGTNMAFRRSVFKKVGLFDEQLGRIGLSSFQTGEETDLFFRIEQSGGVIYYKPSAIVYHIIHPERIHDIWLCHQTYWIGISSAIIERKFMKPLNIFWKGLISIAIIITGFFVWVVSVISKNRYLQVYLKCIMLNRSGYLRGMFKK
ncbi:glycosyltransferase family 2 protein [Thermodesulfobacteriota bacterium]